MTVFPGTSGDDIFVISAATNGDQYNGGAGNDTIRLAQPPLILTNPFGSWWFYNFTGITFSSVEKVDFSTATGQTNQVNLLTSQFGPALLNNFQINGGSGADKLIISASVAGTYTMPSITKANWTTDTSIAGLQSLTDIVALIGNGSANYTLNATDIHTGIEALIGGSGNDTLNGGSSQDVLNGGAAGTDVLNGGGGDDFLGASNQIGQFNTFATTAFNGGTGVDTLVISGDVDFQGSVSSIEHLRLNPAVAAGPGSMGFNNAVLTITESVASQFFPTLTLIEGFGDIEYTMESNTFDASAIQVAPGSHIEFDVFGTIAGDTMTGSAADEVFFGDDGNDVIFGGAGNDGLVGDNGNDTMTGGAGNDVFAVSYGNDVVTDFIVGQDQIAVPDVLANFDMLKPYMSQVNNDTVLSFTYGGAQHTLTLQNVSLASLSSASLFATDYNSGDPGTAGNDFLFGSNLGDTFDGLGGNDIIFAGVGGPDQILGGSGNDTVVVTASQPSVTNPFVNSSFDGGTGTDVLRVSAFGAPSQTQPPSYVANFAGLSVTGFEQLQFQANAGSIVQAMFGLSQINGSLAGMTVDGSAGSDALLLFAGSGGTVNMPNLTRTNWSLDLTPQTSSSSALNSDIVLLIAANAASTLNTNLNHVGVEGLLGSNFNDILNGGNDTDFLNPGGNGADQLFGGGGTDMLVVTQGTPQGNYSDDLFDGGTGTDYLRVNGTVTFAGTLANMEGIWLAPASVGAANTPSFADAQLTVDAAHAAAFGANALLRGKGSVIVNATAAGTINLSGWQFETAPITVTINGSSGVDTLTGTSHDDIIDGGASIDTMAGGLGNDSYYIDRGTDIIVENSNEGTDTVFSSISYALRNIGASVENLTLLGSANINGIGNGFANIITGNSGNNILNGVDGNDTLIGGAGDDTFKDDGGADTMIGGTGNDIYYVDKGADIIVENANEGIDQVFSNVSYSLRNVSQDIENLTLTGTASINGIGNNVDNIIIGNTGDNVINGAVGNDTLDGGVGTDTMIGGTGNDIYYVDRSGDIVTEFVNEGTDLVYSSVSYALRNQGQFIENLTLTGSSNINGIGNDRDNVITGNSGNNILNGSIGNDTLIGGAGDDTFKDDGGTETMIGGTGNDTYWVDKATDTITELVNEGTDQVFASVSYALRNQSQYIENLTLVGGSNINGIGNDRDNVITGNSGINVLNGSIGNDTLIGGAGDDSFKDDSGSDTFTGGTGVDHFIWANNGQFGGLAYANADRITDFSSIEGDKVELNLLDANSLVAGDQAFAFIGAAAFSNTAGELHYINNGVDTLLEGDTNGDGVADFAIKLDGLLTLQASDFVL